MASILLWCALHSALATDKFKALAQDRLGPRGFRGYRLAYNLFSLLSFLPAAYFFLAAPDTLLYELRRPWAVALRVVQLLGITLGAISLLQTDVVHFLGLRQLAAEKRSAGLKTTGLFRHVRHPLYTLGLLLLWASPVMTVNHATAAALLTAYLFVGARLEEARLVREFGAQYEAYRKVTPMIVPGRRRRAP